MKMDMILETLRYVIINKNISTRCVQLNLVSVCLNFRREAGQRLSGKNYTDHYLYTCETVIYNILRKSLYTVKYTD
jgi:hypothetical protein